MLLILLSSIMFVILRPVSTRNTTTEKTEKSHVEKLLTEPSQVQEQKEIEQEKEPEKIITDVFNESIYIPQRKEEYQEKPTPQPFEQINQTQKIEKLTEMNKSDKNYQSISNELMQKYGNNPNAEVSEEDIQNFMIKMLDVVQRQSQ
ncbi:hypothetical protein IJ707_03935 [bacterium]|nr:hypothetical protein [bacterium]